MGTFGNVATCKVNGMGENRKFYQFKGTGEIVY